MGWRVGQGCGVRGSGDQGEQSGSGVGWLVVKIWRSGDLEIQKCGNELLMSFGNRAGGDGFFRGCFVGCDRTKSDR